jgi:hypothetical protein
LYLLLPIILPERDRGFDSTIFIQVLRPKKEVCVFEIACTTEPPQEQEEPATKEPVKPVKENTLHGYD